MDTYCKVKSMYYNRKIYRNLLEHANTPSVTVLTGMRRTGKTTLVRRLLGDMDNKNSVFLDLQRLDNRELFGIKNYDIIYNDLVSRGLNKDLPSVVAIDELQLAPDAPSAIKYLYDNFGIKFIVTGSSSYYLKNVFSESLSGRKKLFELRPLDFGEFLVFKGGAPQEKFDFGSGFNPAAYARNSEYYSEYIRYGGFPQVVLESDPGRKDDILSDILSSYIDLDVRALADFSSTDNLLSLIKLLATRSGSRIEQSTLARIIGISRPTLANYLSFLEKTYLISRVSVQSTSTTREIVKAKKVYFCDTGLANSIVDLSSGAQFENALYNQLSMIGEVRYFSLKAGLEVDFVLDSSLALEAKESPDIGDVAQLKRLSDVMGIEKYKLVGRYKTASYSDYIWGGSIV